MQLDLTLRPSFLYPLRRLWAVPAMLLGTAGAMIVAAERNDHHPENGAEPLVLGLPLKA